MIVKTHNVDWELDIPNTWIFPGSFNPLHEGHTDILRRVTVQYGFSVLELSKTNVDKPALHDDEVDRRLSIFEDYPAIVTDAPKFVDKMKYGARKFVVGADTLNRIMWFHPVQDIMDMYQSGVRFVVVPRGDMLYNGNLYEFTCDLPRQCRIMIDRMVEGVLDYNNTVSSTEIRKKQNEK